MNDIDRGVHNSLLSSFADDTGIRKTVGSLEDVGTLQKDLSTVYQWATISNMSFNDDKFQLLRCGPREDIKTTTSLHTGKGQNSEEVLVVKCLGVHLSADATFHHHITKKKY